MSESGLKCLPAVGHEASHLSLSVLVCKMETILLTTQNHKRERDAISFGMSFKGSNSNLKSSIIHGLDWLSKAFA